MTVFFAKHVMHPERDAVLFEADCVKVRKKLFIDNCVDKRSFAIDNGDLRAGNFKLDLRFIPEIRKKMRLALRRTNENSVRAGKSDQVMDVRQMRDQQSIQSMIANGFLKSNQ